MSLHIKLLDFHMRERDRERERENIYYTPNPQFIAKYSIIQRPMLMQPGTHHYLEVNSKPKPMQNKELQ